MQRLATGDHRSDEISFRLHEAAVRNQEAAESAVRKMQETDRLLRERIGTFPEWLAGEVDKRLENVVRDTARRRSILCRAEIDCNEGKADRRNRFLRELADCPANTGTRYEHPGGREKSFP
jgi:hypothetical protein